MTSPWSGPARLVPTPPLLLPDEPDTVHLSVLTLIPRLDEWWPASPAICGRTVGGHTTLAETTEVTCSDCLQGRPRWEQIIARSTARRG